MLSIIGHGTVTTKRSQSVHRLYVCVRRHIVERRSSATRFTSLPTGHFLNWQLDAHNNHLARVLFPNKTSEFVVAVDLVAELSPFNPFDFFLEPGVENYPFEYAPDLAKDLEPYRSFEPAGPLLQTFPQEAFPRKARNDQLLG